MSSSVEVMSGFPGPLLARALTFAREEMDDTVRSTVTAMVDAAARRAERRVTVLVMADPPAGPLVLGLASEATSSRLTTSP